MIKELIINNFQSHASSRLVFNEGLNVITGSSDSGKTSVLRAILWLANNRPSGDAIKNWDCGNNDVVAVSLLLNNHPLIIKSRSNGKSSYSMNGKKYGAIKTDVPDEVTNALNLSEFNVQSQHQPYFLLNDSAGEVSKKLNKIIGLDIIDTLFMNINSEIQIINSEIRMIGPEIAELDEKIESLSYVDDVMIKFVGLETDIKKYKELIDKFDELSGKIKSYKIAGLNKKAMNTLLGQEKEMNELMDLVNQHENTTDKMDSLIRTLKKHADNKLVMGDLDEKIIDYQKKYELNLRKNNVCPLLEIKCKELRNYGL